MAGNNERNNSYFDERNMSPTHSHRQQYSPVSPGYNIDNNNFNLRPPPGLSPVPHFAPASHMHGNHMISGLGNQQLSYPLMAKNTNGNNFYNATPPPGYSYFTPPQSPSFMSPHQIGNTTAQMGGLAFESFDQVQHHQNQGFGQQSSMYNFPPNNNYHMGYEADPLDSPFLDYAESAYRSGGYMGGGTAIGETNSGGVIEPIIENIVGTSSGGTYTHFGPTQPVSGMSGFNNQARASVHLPTFAAAPNKVQLHGNIGEGSNLEKNQWKDALYTPKSENGNITAKLDSHAVQRPATPISPALSSKSKNNTPTVASSADLAAGQNSLKPSYVEILTKNAKTSENLEKNALPRKTYASASDVQTSRDSPTSQVSSGHPFVQIHNQAHRKLSDGYLGYAGGDGGASNSSTASSSPIVKPKASQHSHLKGKENMVQTGNNLGSPIKSMSDNNNGHILANQKSNEWTKKIGNGKKSGINSKFGGKQTNLANNLGVNNDGFAAITTFDFDPEDLDDEEDADEDQEEKGNKKKNEGTSAKAKKSIGNGFVNNGGNENRRVSDGKGSSGQASKKGKDKVEKPRSRREGRNCTIRRVRAAGLIWLGHLLAALNWLWSLLVSVTTLSATLGYSLLQDVYIWWKNQAVPKFIVNFRLLKGEISKLRAKITLTLNKWNFWSKKETPQKKPPDTPGDLSELLSILGPERNVALPANGDEALQRLLSVKGKDPYSILGVRSDSGDETIRRYYKKQAVLVHPDKNLIAGAEEAFKILARAFELVGEPLKRAEYHRQLLEAHAKERFMGEFGNLFEELRKKMESVCTTIKCTKCNLRHKKNRTNRPVFAARHCAQCDIHHGAREGELWAEKKGFFGYWQFYCCMGNIIWEMNEWGKCQRKSLKHLVPDSHAVIYRLVSGTQARQPRSTNCPNPANPDEEIIGPEMDDFDSLMNNLYRGGPSNGTTCNGSSSSHCTHPKGTSRTLNGQSTANGSAMNSSSSAKKRKGKRK